MTLVNETPQHRKCKTAKKKGLARVVVAGTVSGAASCLLLQPLDFVKTRIQYPTVAAGAKKSKPALRRLIPEIARTEGCLAFWKGLSPSLLRVVPGVSLYFVSLEVLESRFVPSGCPSSGENLLLGAVARVVAGVTLLPATVLKTRFESSVYKYSGIVVAFREILRKEGWKGLYSGLVPTILRDAPFSGIYLMSYRWQKSLLKLKMESSKPLDAGLRFGCGVNAGAFACALTHPFDMVKTRLQLFPNRYESSLAAGSHVYKEFGLAGFYRGFVPRVLRRTLMAALSWTVFEEMLIYFKYSSLH